jgi:uncharacterized protein (TIGR02680 family)
MAAEPGLGPTPELGSTTGLGLAEVFAERPSPVGALPSPVKERWHPLRGGLLNLYRYDDEVFAFEHGRLLLRGNNGTGKSRVLALQLPFLLDGEIAPHRVEPDGDPAKRMEWNLLMGRHEERLGYTWIEFGRRLPEGGARFLTLGCGLRALEGKSGVQRWFFHTSQRVGQDLHLKTQDGRPLTRDQLGTLLGSCGQIVDGVDEWRRTVDQLLFRLGPRYEALIELLIRLRHPQLSRKLDEKVLSAALSEALTPLPMAVVDDVAEAFRSLQSDREEVLRFSAVRRAVSAFLEDYRRYLRTSVRRRAAGVRSMHSAYEEAQRQLRTAERQETEQTEEQQRARREIERLAGELAASDAAIRTFEDSPEMRSVRELQRAREEEVERARAAAEAVADLEATLAAAHEAESFLGEREATTAEQAEQARQQATLAVRCAAEADLKAAHEAVITGDGSDAPPPEPWLQAAARQWQVVLERRRHGLEVLRNRNRELEKAVREHQTALGNLRQAEAAESRSLEDEALTRQKSATAAEELLTAYSQWHRELVVLRCDPAEELMESFGAWTEQRAGDSPLQQGADEALRKAQARIAGDRAAAEQRDHELALELQEIEAEQSELRRGAQRLPPPPAWRKAAREGRSGLPLWRTCDFRPDMPADLRAGLEAALDASGLLDAWVLPDGTLIDPATEDAFLVCGLSSAPLPVERTLARWLAPAVDPHQSAATGLDSALIEQVLEAIGGEPESGTHWVTPAGDWRLGPLHGHARKTEAEFIGERAREAARLRRLAELVKRSDELLELRRGVAEQLGAAEAAQLAAQEERKRLPDHEPLRAAGAAIDAAITALQRAREMREAASALEAQANSLREVLQAARDRDAADLGLSAWVERPEELAAATAAYREALAALGPMVRGWQLAWLALSEARQRLEQARFAVDHRAERRADAVRLHEEALGRVAALAGSLGVSEAEILERLAREKRHKETLIEAREREDAAERAALAAAAAAHSNVERFVAERQEREAQRQTAIAHLQTLALHGVLREADPDLASAAPSETGWSASFTVELARALNERLQDAPEADEAWQRLQQDVFRHVDTLRDELIPQGYHPDTSPIDEGLVLVRCPFQGRLCTMSELDAVLADDLALRQRLLDEREREVIENHLLGEAAAELQRLIRDAERWVENTNRELTARPTSTGMQLKFVWEADPDGPPGLEAARRQLLRANALWTADERAGLARFLQERIRAERNADESGTWRDQLAAALDYRRWHRFSVLRHQDGQWRRLTRATYGTSSGGEKALALTIPQFAAAAAHYASADPHAPRLILLDEVFVGIDSDMRAKCMGLLATFDLDFVMTSEREWGCYPTLPGLAICQLSSRPGIDAVLVTPWVWNGEDLRQVQRLAASQDGQVRAANA